MKISFRLSEKVKEIKNALECLSGHKPCNLCSYHELAEMQETCCMNVVAEEVIEYINELESENERLLESCKNCHYIKDLEIANGHAKELKDRIALLQKDNELLRNAKVVYENVDYCYEDLKKAEKRIAELEKEKTKEKQIELVNDIVFNAIMHGADPGGSYDCNEQGLIDSMKNWLKFNKIKGYVVREIERKDDWNAWWIVMQIVKE